ncbi:TetR/AcrR family transcriptional regulator [Limosilactobacillus kribbianus]|uniref:TetR/AcrR family transcriptional regulator n=1 Tax=Limosilactobacillus kribbianus TaxID=2982695 RepID=UPI002263C590|nr:helix-turn-helix domain-containing protein [Limosilactobacillus kribbianus]
MRTDAQHNRQKIFKATEQLLAENAADQITMAQIARAAGVGVGTLYRNFPTRGDLFISLAYAQLDDYLAREETLIQNKDISRETVRQVLGDYLSFREHRQHLLPTGSLESATQYYSRPNYQRLHHLFANLIGKTNPGLSSITVAFRSDMLIACLRGDSYYLQRTERQLVPEQILDQLMALFFPE